jgi:hypothetical protein
MVKNAWGSSYKGLIFKIAALQNEILAAYEKLEYLTEIVSICPGLTHLNR